MRRIALTALLGLTACATTETPPPPTAAPNCPPTRGWSAFVNAMPGPGAQPTLIVNGEVDLPPSTHVTLRPGPTDRMMPPGQRFVLAIEPSKEMPVLGGWQEVRGEIKPALPQYREILITCDGKQVGRIDGSAIETAH